MTQLSPAARLAAMATGAYLLLGVGCPLAAAADDGEGLGRLFFTPERRQQLDRQREFNLVDQQQLPAEPTLTIDGIVIRSNGRRTAWVNGSPQNEDEPWNGLTVTPRHGDPGKVLVETGDSPAARTRVGQTVNRNTGESIDLLNGGELRVHSRSPASR